jgi:ribosomal protein S18 acetylase RimI-like enzyme
MMRNPESVLLAASQLESASEILATAFKDDPLFAYFTHSDERRRLNSLQWLSKTILHYALPDRAVYATDGMSGVAIWIPPHQFPLNELRLLQAGAYALPFKLRTSRLLAAIPLYLQIEACHHTWMSQPHWYLLMLGVAPAWQNCGVGGALLAPVLAKADRDNLPCYLETSTAAAVRFYQRQGFEVVATIDFDRANTCIWAMKRDPQ